MQQPPDFKTSLIALLFSSNKRAQLIGVAACIPLGFVFLQPVVINEKLTWSEKIYVLCPGITGFLLTLGAAAIDPRSLRDRGQTVQSDASSEDTNDPQV